MMEKKLLAWLSVSGILLAGCQNTDGQHIPHDKAVKVKVTQVSSFSETRMNSFSGTIEDESSTVLSFPIMGTVDKVHIHLGDHVRKGQLLATLHPTTMQSNYNAAHSALAQAEDAYRRMKELHEKGSLPEIKWIEVQSKLEQARSMEEIAKKNLEDCKLYAPFSGVISEKNIESGQNIMPGTPVAGLVTGNRLKVKISVPETEIAAIRLQRKALVSIPALEGKVFTGIVTEKGVVAHPLSRSYDVKLRLNEGDVRLMPGMVVKVSLEQDASLPACYTVPAHIIQLDEKNQSFVWTENNGVANKRSVTCGEFTPDGVTIVSGLGGNDNIIVEGQHKVCEGIRVTY